MHTPLHAPRASHGLHDCAHLPQRPPCRKRSAKLPYPAPLLLPHLLIKRGIRQAARGIEPTPPGVSPTPPDSDLPRARLRAWLRRRAQRSRRWLPLALPGRSQPGKLVPGRVIVPCLREPAGGCRVAVLEGRRRGLRLTKRRAARGSRRPLSAPPLARYARFRPGVWPRRTDHGPVGGRDRRHAQRCDIVLAHTMGSLRSRPEANADPHAAWLLTTVACLLPPPPPIVRLGRGPTALGIAQPPPPQTAARPCRGLIREWQHRQAACHRTAGAGQPGGGGEAQGPPPPERPYGLRVIRHGLTTRGSGLSAVRWGCGAFFFRPRSRCLWRVRGPQALPGRLRGPAHAASSGRCSWRKSVCGA